MNLNATLNKISNVLNAFGIGFLGLRSKTNNKIDNSQPCLGCVNFLIRLPTLGIIVCNLTFRTQTWAFV